MYPVINFSYSFQFYMLTNKNMRLDLQCFIYVVIIRESHSDYNNFKRY